MVYRACSEVYDLEQPSRRAEPAHAPGELPVSRLSLRTANPSGLHGLEPRVLSLGLLWEDLTAPCL